MPIGWSALVCDGCGGKLKMAGAPFAFTLSTDAHFSEEAIARLYEMFDDMAEHPSPHRPLILSGSAELHELRHPLGGVLRCENCGMLYERQSAETT